MRSIRRALLVGIIGAVLITDILAGILVHRTTRASIGGLLDEHLRLIASSVPTPHAPADHLAAEHLVPLPLREPAGEGIVIQIRSKDGLEIYSSSPGWLPPDDTPLGFATVPTSKGAMRTYGMERDGLIVRTAQPMSFRTRIATRTALQQAAPLAVLSIILALLIWLIVGRGLAPLTLVREALARRAPDSLQPLGLDGIPSELRAVVNGIDSLMTRLDAALRNQRAFLADAAHELRTPLAAVRLQADLLRRADTPFERQLASDQLGRGLTRLATLVDQLLLLAREDAASEIEPELADLDPATLLADCAAEQVALAEARQIDLGVADDSAPPGSLRLRGDPQALAILLSNLVGNALRYIPAGGRVDLWCGSLEGAIVWRVDDDGPGIPAAERERVFDRFYRTDWAMRSGHREHGSGLGLSIVRQIALRHHASVRLLDTPAGSGLRVEIRFPAPASAPPRALPDPAESAP